MVLEYLKGLFVFVFSGVLPIGERCWFSNRFFDIHDYPVSKGGDGQPSHFHTYECWACGKKFTI